MKDSITFTSKEIKSFLCTVDKMFPVPLSQKVDLSAYAEKLHRYATLCGIKEDGHIVAMVAGYTRNTEDTLGYIAIVSVLPKYRRRGYAKKLVQQFVVECKEVGLQGVHLYAKKENLPAVKMYEELGFQVYHPEYEPRLNDLHLICYFGDKTKENDVK